MTALFLIASTQISLGVPTKQVDAPDLLRFINNDTLHGNFLSFGANDTIKWKNPEAVETISFSTSKLHRIVFNRGMAHKPLSNSSNVKLINGDVIPCKIISANSKSVEINTDHLGKLQIPRNTISQVTPNPFGGKLLYHGPLNDEGWKTLDTAKINDEQKTSPKEKDNDDDKLTDWQHIGSAWYAGTNKNQFLLRENAMPDKCRLSFKLAWRTSLYAKIALHADCSPPQYEHKKISSQLDMGATVGRAYVLNLSSHSASLYSCTFDDEGKPINTRLDGNQSNLRLSGADSAEFELRIDRTQKNILLYVDKEFKVKWHLGEEYDGKGDHLAFRNLQYNNAELRVSDIVIANWNGMKDSASSMKSSTRDVVLLNNGLDRFSGTLGEISDGTVSFKGSFNSSMVIPIEEIGEIQLASKKDKMIQDKPPKSVYFYIYPHGRITGIPHESSDGQTKLTSALLGDLSLDTRYINLIDFSHKNSLLDNWDDNF